MNAKLKRANTLHKAEAARWEEAWADFGYEVMCLLPEDALERIADDSGMSADEGAEVLAAYLESYDEADYPQWYPVMNWLEAETHVLDAVLWHDLDEKPSLSVWPDRYAPDVGMEVPEVSEKLWGLFRQMVGEADPRVSEVGAWWLCHLAFVRVASLHTQGERVPRDAPMPA